MKTFTGQKTKRLLIAHGEYSSTAPCWTKVPAIFRGTFGILEYLFIYSTISGGTPNDVPRNPG